MQWVRNKYIEIDLHRVHFYSDRIIKSDFQDTAPYSWFVQLGNIVYYKCYTSSMNSKPSLQCIFLSVI